MLLLRQLCLPLAAAGAATYSWPPADVSKKTPAKVGAGKRAARYIACEVCTVVMTAALNVKKSDHERVGSILQLLSNGTFAEELGDTKDLCNPTVLFAWLRAGRFDVLTAPNGTARLERTPEHDVHYEDSLSNDAAFHWKSYAAHQACLDSFRGGGTDTIQRSLRKQLKAYLGGKLTETTSVEVAVKLPEASATACRSTKPCVAHVAESILPQATRQRDEARAEKEPEYKPQESDFEAPKTVNYDKHIDYYRILGVDELATSDHIVKGFSLLDGFMQAHGALTNLGIDAWGTGDTSPVRDQLKQAYDLLTDQPTRRQYDRDRDMMRLIARVGGTKVPKDKAAFDGVQAVSLLASTAAPPDSAAAAAAPPAPPTVAKTDL